MIKTGRAKRGLSSSALAPDIEDDDDVGWRTLKAIIRASSDRHPRQPTWAPI
jgi:ribosome-binding protein aMBF1 (putative translation factor)